MVVSEVRHGLGFIAQSIPKIGYLMSGEQTARSLWRELQNLLPSHYRRIRWDEVHTNVKRSMTAAIYDHMNGRDLRTVEETRKQLVDAMINETARDRPHLTLEQLEQVCRVIRNHTIQPPEID